MSTLLKRAQAIKPNVAAQQLTYNLVIAPRHLEAFVDALEAHYADQIAWNDGGNANNDEATFVANEPALNKSAKTPAGTKVVVYAVKLLSKPSGCCTIYDKGDTMKATLVGDMVCMKGWTPPAGEPAEPESAAGEIDNLVGDPA